MKPVLCFLVLLALTMARPQGHGLKVAVRQEQTNHVPFSSLTEHQTETAIVSNVRASSDANALLGEIGVRVTFSCFSDQKDYQPKTCRWDFGDKIRGEGITVTHAYKHAGVFAVSLNMDDGKGNQRNGQMFIRVNAPLELMVTPPEQASNAETL
jgi:hypothetical protein